MANIAVLGSGSFGTSLAVLARKNAHQISLWSYSETEIQQLRVSRENKRCLPGVKIPEEIELTADIACVQGRDLVILAVPSFAIGQTAEKAAAYMRQGTVVASVAKGFDPETNLRLSQVIATYLPKNEIVILSGPSHAEEIARGVPTTVVSASKSKKAASLVQDILMNDSLRIYGNSDLTGVELGGSLKNIIALAAGIVDGLELGDNAKAALITRGLTEIARLGVAMGAKEQTFAGLSGIGDLIVTCTSCHSRNHSAGLLIGQGLDVEEAVRRVGMTVEGIAATKSACALCRQYHVQMPITQQLYKVLYKGKDPREAIAELMRRPKRTETEHIWIE